MTVPLSNPLLKLRVGAPSPAPGVFTAAQLRLSVGSDVMISSGVCESRREDLAILKQAPAFCVF